jgi:hypothetical protein
MATAIGMDRSNFYNKVKAEPELAEAIERGREVGRTRLRRLQWQGAEKGNATMLIWLGKQLLGQRDYAAMAVTGADGGAVKTETKVGLELKNLTPDELLTRRQISISLSTAVAPMIVPARYQCGQSGLPSC